MQDRPDPRRRSERRPRRPPPPLDAASLDRMALRYVERFSTTRGKLADYLRRKVRERGWDGPPPDVEAIADRMAALGYVDDRAFAEARARSMTRRGLGASRIADALRHARVGTADLAAAADEIAGEAMASALRLARRKRIGPYATQPAERPQREKQLAAMLRAGHDFALARRIVDAGPGDVADGDFDGDGTPTHCDDDEAC